MEALGYDLPDTGLIPTCVGNTHGPAAIALRHGAHPHLRGEHFLVVLLSFGEQGSSPPAWGTRKAVHHGNTAVGLIPTCVGNTPVKVATTSLVGAHPHLRGEHERLSIMAIPPLGSSPPAWGTLPIGDRKFECVGLIPTCVGNTFWSDWSPFGVWAHPHLRGEHCSWTKKLMSCWGSSPPAWGTLCRFGSEEVWVGLIPTCVGNTMSSPTSMMARRAHPHLRGEHNSRTLSATWDWGSSPPAWGTRPEDGHRRHHLRLIPTCVGNTSREPSQLLIRRAHPHLRGEHSW